MATLTIIDLAETGNIDLATDLETAAAGLADQFTYNPRTFLYINNGGGGTVVVTFVAQSTTVSPSGFGTTTKADLVMSVLAGDIGISPMLEQAFKDSSGFVQVTYDQVSSVTVGAINFPALTTN